MRKNFISLLLTALILTSIFVTTLLAQETFAQKKNTSIENTGEKTVAVIPIEGEITLAVLVYLKRAIAEAEQEGHSAVVFEINTFGGRLDATYEIVEIITAMKLPSVSLVKEKAISAGTLIALASPKLYMMSGSTMGDVAPVSMGADGVAMLGEKFQSPLRAKFRALAEKNGYPVKLSEAFVSVDKEIIQVEYKNGTVEIIDGVQYNDFNEEQKANIKVKKTLVPKGELLTMNSREAKEFGFSSATVDALEDIPFLNGEDGGKSGGAFSFERLDRLPSERLLSIYEKFSAILILLGLAAIYLEVKNPGFGFYGFTAIAIFVLVFFAQHIFQLANYAELALLLFGLSLLFVEVFIIPGFGIFGITGITFVLAALVLMFQNFTFPSTPFESDIFKTNLQMVGAVFLLATFGFFIMLYFFPKMTKRSFLVLNKVNTADGAVENSTAGLAIGNATSNIKHSSLQSFVGKKAVAASTLRPSGHVQLGGDVLDALTDGVFIAEGSEVKVVGVHGSSLVVAEIEDGEVKKNNNS